MSKKTTPPSISKTAFDCPHCGAFTTQFWFKLHAKEIEEERRTPFLSDKRFKQTITGDQKMPEKLRQHFLGWIKKMETGLVFLNTNDGNSIYNEVNNLYISKCYNCKKIAVWVHDNLVFPHEKQGVLPNADLPEDIIRDFEEARDIVGLSPRGAAALLRLCIQKLCIHLGEKGKNIDQDIANLVSKGLDPLVQKSLDIVRVVGNEAVHPGVIDLRDDRDIAIQLFGLINSIADQRISHPKSVENLYKNLPEEKRKAIEKRDKKT